MKREGPDWWNESRIGRVLLFMLLVVAVLAFAAPCFTLLYGFTEWPLWFQIVISLPVGVLLFACWVKTHELNGFDGIVYDERPGNRNGQND